MAVAPTRSIRRAMLARLMGPLMLLTLVAGAASYAVARHVSDSVLDQWLYDSAISLANRVQWKDDGATVDLPEGARQILEWDVVDRVFYEVVSAQGQWIAGNAQLPAPPDPPSLPGATRFYESRVNGEAVRTLAITVSPQLGQTVVVKVAETQQKRTALARQVLWISLGLSLLLAALSAALIWYGIGRGIASMEKAVSDARRNDRRARLTPIEVAPDMPVEVVPLVGEINRLIEELSASHRVTERFIVNAAHQLRTPVATLRVQLESASRDTDAARRARAVNDAVQVVTHMSRVLQQLLILAKADGQSVNPSATTTLDLDLIARREVERRLDEAVALGIDLGYDGPGQPVVLDGNEDLVREALANLLDNAFRYGAAGGQITVGVRVAPAPELYVEDRGPGIPAEERERVTQRFYRLPGTSGDGCGLGLSIVQEIARLSGATLSLDGVAQGTGLRASLRFADRSAQRPADREYAGPPESGRQDGPRSRVAFATKGDAGLSTSPPGPEQQANSRR